MVISQHISFLPRMEEEIEQNNNEEAKDRNILLSLKKMDYLIH
jgi:hypothetical protein